MLNLEAGIGSCYRQYWKCIGFHCTHHPERLEMKPFGGSDSRVLTGGEFLITESGVWSLKMIKPYRAGLDIGSTTAKIAVLDHRGALVFSDYQRHHARVYTTALGFFHKIRDILHDKPILLTLTGSAALGVGRATGLPFVQETIATHTVIRHRYPDVKTCVDIGGEDSKMIFFEPGRVPDIRMNGSCAGGTGAFIDQMATLMDIPISRLNDLAAGYDHIYPMASRCGVFAKTDVQNMFSRNIPHRDIAASIFHAVSVQCINTLARGAQIRPKILLCGGVFTFLPMLVTIFLKALDIPERQMMIPEHAELIPAMGAARSGKACAGPTDIEALIRLLETGQRLGDDTGKRMAPLFENPSQFEVWKETVGIVPVASSALDEYSGDGCFLGVDSGSTTTKIAVIGESGELLFSWYQNNRGDPIDAVIRGLTAFRQAQADCGVRLTLRRSVVTGYGEDLIRAALNLDEGIVETLAHCTAARRVHPEVTFILDIGGQDMKAIFLENGNIRRIEVNEACSSGCGSFLETLADSLNCDIQTFAALACTANAPCDLGTRCTVFMNSKIKQAQRENASVADISAGLAYSVIKNCLFKVLKLQNPDQIGDHIVLQGGAFKNLSLVRALEQITGRQAMTTRIPELMGAFGAALYARDVCRSLGAPLSGLPALAGVEAMGRYASRQLCCKGCENSCRITQFDFPGGKRFFSGNKCEKHFYTQGETRRRGYDFTEFKIKALFNRELAPHKFPRFTVGIPRALNMYDNFVFWHALFTACGINIRLSSPSTMAMSEKGLGTVMSDNLCFPAKLLHGHIWDLVEQGGTDRGGIDRIFLPMVVYEKSEFEGAANTYNCPVVSSYPDVIESAVCPKQRFGIPFDRPLMTFHDNALLKKNCCRYLMPLGIKRREILEGVETALAAREQFKVEVADKAREIINRSKRDQSLLVVLAGRPYHMDSLINHKIADILVRLGADMITEDAVPHDPAALEQVQVVTQWAYPNRIYNAARWVAAQPEHIQMVQLNSFGCGPDAVVIDEVGQILKPFGKHLTLIRVDEIANPGSAMLRLRSMVASLAQAPPDERRPVTKRPPFVPFKEKDRRRTILAPFFAMDYAAYIPSIFRAAHHDLQILPPPDRESVEIGLRYANNDICYPGIIMIGDIIKALAKETRRPENLAVGITQTGGQCRASNYLSLIKKAMEASGFGQIPIISVTATDNSLADQSGFRMNWLSRIRPLYFLTLYADSIAKMYYATAPRETTPGMGQRLRQHYMDQACRKGFILNTGRLMTLLAKAVEDFNGIPVDKRDLPRMGVVGEIYAKYNYFANQDLVHWLIRQKIEPVLPPLVDYFIQDIVNYKENIKMGLRKRKALDVLGPPIEWMIAQGHRQVQNIFSKFRFAVPFDDIRDVAAWASDILSLSNQFGEGWLIPGEIASFARQNITHAISVQPFGCIANHIISKGVAARIKDVYPRMNLFHLDFDPGMSEANIRNRLHFMIEHL